MVIAQVRDAIIDIGRRESTSLILSKGRCRQPASLIIGKIIFSDLLVICCFPNHACDIARILSGLIAFALDQVIIYLIIAQVKTKVMGRRKANTLHIHGALREHLS